MITACRGSSSAVVAAAAGRVRQTVLMADNGLGGQSGTGRTADAVPAPSVQEDGAEQETTDGGWLVVSWPAWLSDSDPT